LIAKLAKKDPRIVGCSGVEEFVVGRRCKCMCPWGFVKVILDEEVCNLPGDLGARTFVLGSDNPKAPANIYPLKEDVSANKGCAARVHELEKEGIGWARVKGETWRGGEARSEDVIEIAVGFF
jgi:hypothetical protein